MVANERIHAMASERMPMLHSVYRPFTFPLTLP